MAEEPRALVVGRIAKSHGLRGECVVEVLTDAPGERFDKGAVLNAGDPEGTTRPMTITAVRPHQNRLLVQFAGVSDRTAADALRGTLLSVPIDQAAEPGDGRFYPYQLEGLSVRDESGAALGVLQSVLETPAHDVWVVRTPHGDDVMVPAVDEFVRSVDLDSGVIVLSPIGGMFE